MTDDSEMTKGTKKADEGHKRKLPHRTYRIHNIELCRQGFAYVLGYLITLAWMCV